jgi:hypothetical protein
MPWWILGIVGDCLVVLLYVGQSTCDRDIEFLKFWAAQLDQ